MKKLLVLTFLGVCFALWAKVSTDYDHSANFGSYRTYSWMKVKASDQLWENRIKRDVDAALSKQGWQSVDSGGDAAISAFESTREQPQLETFYDGFGGGWGWRGFGGGGTGLSTTSVDNISIGTLIVDIFDGHAKKLLWRSVATDTLSSNNEKDEKKLSSAIDDMFKHFPPKSKG